MNNSSSPKRVSHKLIITVAYYFAFITLGLTVGATGPVLPTLAKHTHTALDGISFIFITIALGYLLGTWIGGRAYDRLPGHLLIAVALVIVSVMLFSIPLISTLWLLTVVMAVVGFFQGSMDVGGNTLLIWLHGSKVGPFMNGMHLFFGIGTFVAPIIIAQITGLSGDINWVYWSFAILNIPIALWIWLLPSPAMSTKAAAAGKPRVRASSFLLALLVAFFFLYVGLEIGYGNWIYTYAITLNLADTTSAAYLTSMFWGAFTLFRLFGVWISSRTSPQNILIGDFAGTAVGLALILVLPASRVALWTGTIILGGGIASVFPTLLTLAEQRMHLTGSITRWFFVGSGVGQMVLPWLIGQLFVSLGASSMMYSLAIDLVLNVLVLALVLWKSQRA